jgi:hypothetical protein
MSIWMGCQNVSLRPIAFSVLDLAGGRLLHLYVRTLMASIS